MKQTHQLFRSERSSNRLFSRPAIRQSILRSRQHVSQAGRVLAPALMALAFASAAHAQGTMDFSGANTLMGTFKTFAIYAGAVICFGRIDLRRHPDDERTFPGRYPGSVRCALWRRRPGLGCRLDRLSYRAVDVGLPCTRPNGENR